MHLFISITASIYAYNILIVSIFIYWYLASLSISIYLSESIYLNLSIWIYLSESIYLSIYLSIHLFIYLNLSIYLSIYLPIYLSIYLSESIYLYLSICIYLSVSIYLYLSICIYLSSYLDILYIHSFWNITLYQWWLTPMTMTLYGKLPFNRLLVLPSNWRKRVDSTVLHSLHYRRDVQTHLTPAEVPSSCLTMEHHGSHRPSLLDMFRLLGPLQMVSSAAAQ